MYLQLGQPGQPGTPGLPGNYTVTFNKLKLF